MSCRIGIDVGGTFTDFVLIQSDGACHTHKQLTTPQQPERAVLEGMTVLLERSGTSIHDVRGIVHGTTLVTNAVIERRGARCGAIFTRGFRTVLDIGKEGRYDAFDLRLEYAPALVPLGRRVEVSERIRPDGTIETALERAQVESALEELVEHHQIESLAVCLINSYRNDLHERHIRDLAIEAYPRLHVTISAEVFPYMREYERWTTATVNAYAQPIIHSYLERLEGGLEELGYRGPFHLMTSSGGIVAPALARRFPVRLLESGPAAGVLMAATVGASLERSEVLAFDMGGTTSKGALIRGGTPLKRYELEVAHAYRAKKGSGLTVRAPAIDLIEIGAGGGSTSTVDGRGVIRVGPESAGAMPGPACYAFGGERPTVTDANLILGYLDEHYFLGGKMALSRQAAEAAARRALGEPLDLTVLRAAWGVHETVNEDIARAFRNHAAERGFDYRRCVMVASGGAAPAHALRVARKLRVPQVIFAPGTGVMSAFGLLVSPLAFEISRSSFVPLEDLTPASFAQSLRDLAETARRPLLDAGADASLITLRIGLDMRYRGQGYDVEVELPQSDDLAALLPELPRLFAVAYERVFATSFPALPLDVTCWKIEARGPQPLESAPRYAWDASPDVTARKALRSAYSPESGTLIDIPVYSRSALRPGERVVGPAMIEEPETTIVVGAADELRVHPSGSLVATPRADGSARLLQQ